MKNAKLKCRDCGNIVVIPSYPYKTISPLFVCKTCLSNPSAYVKKNFSNLLQAHKSGKIFEEERARHQRSLERVVKVKKKKTRIRLPYVPKLWEPRKCVVCNIEYTPIRKIQKLCRKRSCHVEHQRRLYHKRLGRTDLNRRWKKRQERKN